MFSSKKIFLSNSSSNTFSSSSSSSIDCLKQLLPISACKILNSNNDTTGFNIKWRTSDDSYLDTEGNRYSYVWQFCSYLPLVHGPDSEMRPCSEPFDIINGQVVSTIEFESPDPEPDGSFSKTVIISEEGRAYVPENRNELWPYTYQDEINLAVIIELGIKYSSLGRSEFGDYWGCYGIRIDINC